MPKPKQWDSSARRPSGSAAVAHSASDAAAVRAELGLSVTRYWQRVGAMLDDEEAIAYAPVVVNRLRRITGRA